MISERNKEVGVSTWCDFDGDPPFSSAVGAPSFKRVVYGTPIKPEVKNGMSDFDDDRLDCAAEESDERCYPSLRRWHWRFVLGLPASFGLIFALDALKERLPIVQSLLVVTQPVGGLIYFISWFGLFYTVLTLRDFRCPRCGKRFAVSWIGVWPCKTCDHCDFYLG